jgi:hypothetical protein
VNRISHSLRANTLATAAMPKRYRNMVFCNRMLDATRHAITKLMPDRSGSHYGALLFGWFRQCFNLRRCKCNSRVQYGVPVAVAEGISRPAADPPGLPLGMLVARTVGVPLNARSPRRG